MRQRILDSLTATVIFRKIYSDSDADLQLEGFFREVATPLLLNIKIRYSGMNVEKVSKTNVDKYFGGSEVIVVGTMRERKFCHPLTK